MRLLSTATCLLQFKDGKETAFLPLLATKLKKQGRLSPALL